jgi:hypothetical protein
MPNYALDNADIVREAMFHHIPGFRFANLLTFIDLPHSQP